LKIEFVIPTYNRPIPLSGIISSIVAQTNPNWSIHVVADGPYDGFFDVVKLFTTFAGDKIRFSVIDGPNRDWGHSPRNYGIENAREEWLVMTGDDNYYFPNFVQEFLTVVDGDTNFIHCDFYNSHIRWEKHESKVEVNKIDIGNYATRTVHAKNMRLDTKKLNADGYFAVEYVQKYCNLPYVVKKIDKALYIHN
jgi:glycosyltransferase involved in cell wall biosynthesis